MHVVVYLPKSFYAAVAAAAAEIFQVVNELRGRKVFSFEFVARRRSALSRSGIRFDAKVNPTKKVDVLLVLAGAGPDAASTVALHEEEVAHLKPLLLRAVRTKAVIAGTCGAGYLLARAGLLDGKRATIAWWLKAEVARRFPAVRWEPSRMFVREGRVYTSGGAFAGIDLLSVLLVDLGFAKEERQVRKLMVLPPVRLSQRPYEDPSVSEVEPFERKLHDIVSPRIGSIDAPRIAKALGMSSRTLLRRFQEELQTTSGKWLQAQRLARACSLLEETTLSVDEICSRVGYQDHASFSRLFSKTTGMTPREFRRESTTAKRAHFRAAPASRASATNAL